MNAPAARIQWQRLAVFVGAARAGAGGQRLAAGIVENTPENLKAWIRDPAGMKPGVKMPGFPQLSEEDLDALVRYLEGLKVEGFDFGALPKF